MMRSVRQIIGAALVAIAAWAGAAGAMPAGGQESAGRAAETSELVHRQRYARQQLQQLMVRMLELADVLEASEPQAARAMRQAAQEAQRAFMVESMDEVAALVSQGLFVTAGQRQDKVVEDLRAMLATLRGGGAADADDRAAELHEIRRQLAELERLVEAQRQLEKESREAMEGDGGSDPAMMQQQQIGASAVAGRMAGEMLSAGGAVGAEEVSAAAGSMDAAAAKLGQGDAQGANAEQRRALARLAEAHRRLSDLLADEERAARAEQMARVAAALRALLAVQTRINRDTNEAIESSREGLHDRQTQLKLAEIARRQGSAAADAAEIASLLPDEGGGAVLPEALSLVREEMLIVQGLLGDVRAGEMVQTIQAGIVRTLMELLDAMGSDQEMEAADGPPPDGESQPQQRSMLSATAELKLLRAMQQHVNDRTVLLHEQAQRGAEQTVIERVDNQKRLPASASLPEPLSATPDAKELLATTLESQHRLLRDRQARAAESARRMVDDVGEAMAAVAEEMDAAAEMLSRLDSGLQTQERQRRIIAMLDELINAGEADSAGENERSSGGDSGVRIESRSGGSPSGEEMSSPASGSELSEDGRALQRGNLPDVQSTDPSDDWNRLPIRERERLVEMLKEKYPQRYTEMLEAYYRSLSEQR